MLEEILGALVRSQVGDLKRRTTGAVLEGVALGLASLATVFLFVGAHLWLSARIEPWLSALLLAAVALLAALVAMLAGRSLLRRKRRREHEEVIGTLTRLGLLPARRPPSAQNGRADGKPRPGLVLTALAAGILLGRTIGR
ncbi:MAG: phage holin family protein [Paracoccaceae bacterium]|jgi:chromate transport protein ChrA|nr:phage holin family protein [Paracoccaceae bacterium]